MAIVCVETMIEYELMKAKRGRPKKPVGRPSEHWMEDGATSPMSSFKGTKLMKPAQQPKAAPSTYEDLVAAKSPLVQGLTEKEFYGNHNYSSDLGSWIRKPKGQDALTSYIGQAEDRRNLQLLLQKVSNLVTTADDDDDDDKDTRERPPTEEEWESMRIQSDEAQLTPDEIRAIQEDMTHSNPHIPMEDMPERNRPEIPDAFKGAFSDDDSSINKSLYLLKRWLKK